MLLLVTHSVFTVYVLVVKKGRLFDMFDKLSKWPKGRKSFCEKVISFQRENIRTKEVKFGIYVV